MNNISFKGVIIVPTPKPPIIKGKKYMALAEADRKGEMAKFLHGTPDDAFRLYVDNDVNKELNLLGWLNTIGINNYTYINRKMSRDDARDIKNPANPYTGKEKYPNHPYAESTY